FRTHGVETYIEINPFENLTARIDYTWTIIDSDFTGGVLTRRPRHAIGFTTAWQIDDRTTLSGAVNYIDLYRDIDRETGAYINPGSYTVVRIAGAHKLTEWLELTARVNNLLDRQYEPANGFQAAGIEALAGIAVTF
ncbi:MAG: TonB-dependent receptor, partial [Parvibaculum sp.]|nr:TonB-dependent receptor [Parvibaculum sp.]